MSNKLAQAIEAFRRAAYNRGKAIMSDLSTAEVDGIFARQEIAHAALSRAIAADRAALIEALRATVNAIENCHGYRSHMHFEALAKGHAALVAAATQPEEVK